MFTSFKFPSAEAMRQYFKKRELGDLPEGTIITKQDGSRFVIGPDGKQQRLVDFSEAA